MVFIIRGFKKYLQAIQGCTHLYKKTNKTKIKRRSKMENKITKTSFREATTLKKVWNQIVTWNEYNIGTVQWHQNREWKIVAAGVNFDTIAERSYKPLAEFHTQEELWQYIKTNNKGVGK